MNPFRLINPRYVLKLEREVRSYASSYDRIVDAAERVAERAGADPDIKLITNMRSSLLSVADALASGRTNDAKVMVDAIILVLQPKENADG